ncbi:hypothetical protein [Sphingobacterium cellulitidis]|uniref:Uncharacterized protein n=1 Tax=Sphingobacterium cellulitidis TaxID=1768011 RepID=A0A8H9KVA9_9SPHI|nr:hypothetical protein [Sphingobacterium soli]MBA8987133.1 hypothetical protein [Sphingobacterium soli]GGE16611.1 hypothetical protein GCM10011516_12940 [Sphingobacterium soli]
MNNKILSLLAVPVLVISLSSCQNSNPKSEVGHSTESGKDWTASELAGKYSFEDSGDTIVLELNNHNDSLVGPLNYNFEEKDKNEGVFRGVIKDSLLVGQYTFMSEGVSSVRETVFGIVPEGLIEGFGDVEERDSMMVFKNMDSLRFDHGMILHKK